MQELIGTKINKLTIIGEGDKIKEGNKNRRGVICKCDCGEIRNFQLLKFIKGNYRSCGSCYKNLIGANKGSLKIIEYVGLNKYNNRVFKTRCENCGKEKEYTNNQLENKKYCSCQKPKKQKPIIKNTIKGIYIIHYEIEQRSDVGNRMVHVECTKCNERYNLVYKNIRNNKYGCAKCGIKNYEKPNKVSESYKRLNSII